MPRRAQRPRPEERPSLYVSGCNFFRKTGDAEPREVLIKMCEAVTGKGSVARITVKISFCFIDFTAAGMAQKAAEALNGAPFLQSTLVARVQTVENHREAQAVKRQQAKARKQARALGALEDSTGDSEHEDEKDGGPDDMISVVSADVPVAAPLPVAWLPTAQPLHSLQMVLATQTVPGMQMQQQPQQPRQPIVGDPDDDGRSGLIAVLRKREERILQLQADLQRRDLLLAEKDAQILDLSTRLEVQRLSKERVINKQKAVIEVLSRRVQPQDGAARLATEEDCGAE